MSSRGRALSSSRSSAACGPSRCSSQTPRRDYSGGPPHTPRSDVRTMKFTCSVLPSPRGTPRRPTQIPTATAVLLAGSTPSTSRPGYALSHLSQTTTAHSDPASNTTLSRASTSVLHQSTRTRTPSPSYASLETPCVDRPKPTFPAQSSVPSALSTPPPLTPRLLPSSMINADHTILVTATPKHGVAAPNARTFTTAGASEREPPAMVTASSITASLSSLSLAQPPQTPRAPLTTSFSARTPTAAPTAQPAYFPSTSSALFPAFALPPQPAVLGHDGLAVVAAGVGVGAGRLFADGLSAEDVPLDDAATAALETTAFARVCVNTPLLAQTGGSQLHLYHRARLIHPQYTVDQLWAEHAAVQVDATEATRSATSEDTPAPPAEFRLAPLLERVFARGHSCTVLLSGVPDNRMAVLTGANNTRTSPGDVYGCGQHPYGMMGKVAEYILDRTSAATSGAAWQTAPSYEVYLGVAQLLGETVFDALTGLDNTDRKGNYIRNDAGSGAVRGGLRACPLRENSDKTHFAEGLTFRKVRDLEDLCIPRLDKLRNVEASSLFVQFVIEKTVTNEAEAPQTFHSLVQLVSLPGQDTTELGTFLVDSNAADRAEARRARRSGFGVAPERVVSDAGASAQKALYSLSRVLAHINAHAVVKPVPGMGNEQYTYLRVGTPAPYRDHPLTRMLCGWLGTRAHCPAALLVYVGSDVTQYAESISALRWASECRGYLINDDRDADRRRGRSASRPRSSTRATYDDNFYKPTATYRSTSTSRTRPSRPTPAVATTTRHTSAARRRPTAGSDTRRGREGGAHEREAELLLRDEELLDREIALSEREERLREREEALLCGVADNGKVAELEEREAALCRREEALLAQMEALQLRTIEVRDKERAAEAQLDAARAEDGVSWRDKYLTLVAKNSDLEVKFSNLCRDYAELEAKLL